MKISDYKKDYTFSVKIELDGNEWIEIKEPTVEQFNSLSKANGDDVELTKLVEKFLPSNIVDSSFTNEKGEKANGDEISEMLKGMSTLETAIITGWIKSIPFQNRLNKKDSK